MSSRSPAPLAGPLVPPRLDADPGGLAKGLAASVGKKYVMGWTGLLWCGFLVMHLAGNFAIFFPGALNAYAEKLESLGPVILIAEGVLALLILLHVVMAVWVTLENWAARPDAYAASQGKGEKTLASSTMIWTGLYVLVFLTVHLINIRFAPDLEDVFATTFRLFQSPFYVVFYVVGVCLLGFHVSHGFASGFRTIGVHGKRITPRIEKLGIAFGFLVAIGYGSIPLWAILTGGAA
jgi:succinate dehydrogenase / fumarate reductase cytochrome b subunit